MSQVIKLQMKCYYEGHDIKKSGIVNLKVGANYQELVNIVPMIQLLNNNIRIGALVPGKEKALTIGSFMINSLKINSDGTSNITLNAIVDNVNLSNINEMVPDEKDSIITLLIRGEIELEGANEDGE